MTQNSPDDDDDDDFNGHNGDDDDDERDDDEHDEHDEHVVVIVVVLTRSRVHPRSSALSLGRVQARSRRVLDVAEPVLSLASRTPTSIDAVVLAREANQWFGHLVSLVTRRRTRDPRANRGYSQDTRAKPAKNPYPRMRVRVFGGLGTGWPWDTRGFTRGVP